MNKIKNIIKNHKKIYTIVSSVRFLLSANFLKIKGSKKKYPKVIQLPLTYRCNLKCVMCNVWKMDHSNEMLIEEFSKYMKDPIFKEVESVGINGGEPSLIKNLEMYAKKIMNLPKIKSLNIISNGFSSKLLLGKLESIYATCKKKNVNFHVSISLDGVGEIHDFIRGMPGVFEKTTSTIDEIMKNKHKYCDSIDIACTIVKQNIDNLIELDVYAKSKGYNVRYRLGIKNKRIGSEKITNQYCVIYDNLKQTVKEFFHSRISKAKTIYDKFKYFAIYYFLDSKTPKRLLGCAWKDEGITIDSRGNVYYCAVASNKIGSLREKSGEKIFFDEKNIEFRKSIIENQCDKCIHDYSGKPELKNVLIFIKYLLNERFCYRIYKLKASLL